MLINRLIGTGKFSPPSAIIPSSTGEKNNFISTRSDVFTLSIPEEKSPDSYKKQSEERVKPETEYSFSHPSEISPNQGNSPVTIGIIHINDEHDNTFKKFPRESAIVREREEHYGDENSFIINLGDVTYNGSNKDAGPKYFGPVTDIFNSIDVELFVPGNHDLDHGGNYLEKEVISKLEATTLAGNVEYESGKPLENTKPYTIEEVNGVKVGFIGLTTPKHKEHGKNDKAVTVTPILESAEKYVPEVKSKGADIVVLLMHEGVNTAKTVAGSVPGIDIVIAGHDHKKCVEEVKNPDGRNTLVVEAGGNTNYVGDIALQIEPLSKKIIKVDYKLFSTAGVTPDKETAEIINRYRGSFR